MQPLNQGWTIKSSCKCSISRSRNKTTPMKATNQLILCAPAAVTTTPVCKWISSKLKTNLVSKMTGRLHKRSCFRTLSLSKIHTSKMGCRTWDREGCLDRGTTWGTTSVTKPLRSTTRSNRVGSPGTSPSQSGWMLKAASRGLRSTETALIPAGAQVTTDLVSDLAQR